MTPIAICNLDTGYSHSGETNQNVNVYHHDFVPPEEGMPGYRPAYIPHGDGLDSVPNGHGTQTCNHIVQVIHDSKVPMAFSVISLKIGDSSTPLLGPNVKGVKPALRFVIDLVHRYPTWRFVICLNWNVPAIGETAAYLDTLSSLKVPLVLPAGENNINCDLLYGFNPKGVYGPLSRWVPSYGGVLVAGTLNPNSNFGVKTVHLAVDEQDSTFSAATAAAWVAVSRNVMPNADASAVIARVKSSVTPNPICKDRMQTGGVLSGIPH